jgi:hypothetical protein
MTAPRLVIAALLLGMCLVVLAVDRSSDRPSPRPAEATASADGASVDPAAAAVADGARLDAAAAVLRSWDRRRAAAYAAGSPDRLAALYVRDAGVADVRLLERYRSRGWRVVGLRMQVLALSVVGRGPGRLRLRVTDRLASAVAVRAKQRVALPRDRAGTRLVTLTRTGGGRWRVASVRG